MLATVVFCPQAPAFVPAVGCGLDAELGSARAAARAAIERAAAGVERVMALGSGQRTASYGPTSRGSFAGFGVPLEVALGSDAGGPIELPPALAVAAWLLHDALGAGSGATGWSVGPEGLPDAALDADASTMLLVVGDGSARRTEKAPGYLDPRAVARDEEIVAALRGGDGAGLLSRPDDEELLVAGSYAWDAVGRVTAPTAWHADVLYADAPFGVGYVVARWTLSTPVDTVDSMVRR